MGYPMAVNLRKGLGHETTLLICDVNQSAIAKFRKEMEGQGPIEVVDNGLEAVQRSVSSRRSLLSWGEEEERRG